MNFELHNQRILVTGATSGIGLDIARSLAELGAELVLFGRNRDQLAKLEKELGARTLAVDITDEAAVVAAFVEMPVLDGLVNCAGISILDDVLDFKARDIENIMNTNVTASAVVAFQRQWVGNMGAANMAWVTTSLIELECTKCVASSSGKLWVAPREITILSSRAAACNSKLNWRQKRLRMPKPQARLTLEP